MNLTVVIPAYNEEKTIGDVVAKIFNFQFSIFNTKVIVVDDGSVDNTARAARQAGALILSHPINRGLGAALATGLEAACRLGGDIIITLDADGQHDPAEIPSLIEPILKGEAEVVLGSRFIKFPIPNSQFPIPWSRGIANWIGNLVTYLLFSLRVTDSQSGFRAFSRAAAEKIRIRGNTMEVSSEIIREIKFHNLKFKEVPITPIYTEYSLSKGQGFFKGLETLWKLVVLKFFR